MLKKLNKKKLKILCIIQARLSSKRLPKKVLLPGGGNKPLLINLYERIIPSKTISKIIVATSKNSSDDRIVNICKYYRVPFFRGSLKNVLKRYYDCAKKYKADYIIRVTSDCPLLEYNIVDRFIKSFLKIKKCDYYSNVHPRVSPKGYDLEIFNFKSLETCFLKSKSDYEKEHVTPYIWKNKKKFLIKSYKKKEKNFKKIRLTLDYYEDYLLIKNIFDHFYSKNKYFNHKNVTKYLNSNKIKNLNLKYL